MEQGHYKIFSLVLVVLQFGSLIFLGLNAWPFDLLWHSFTLMALAVFLALWAILEMIRRSKLNILPQVREQAKMVVTGPYRVVRHPMYLSLIVMALGLFLQDIGLKQSLALLLLLLVLILKIELEERILRFHFKGYGEYQLQGKKLIPFVY